MSHKDYEIYERWPNRIEGAEPVFYAWAGNAYLEGQPGQVTQTLEVKNLPKEKTYMVHAALSMLSGQGGDFDENDTVFADIFSIDGQRLDSTNTPGGGVWEDDIRRNRDWGTGYHFGVRGDVSNQALSSYVGNIQEKVMFRLVVMGDAWAGASFFIIGL